MRFARPRVLRRRPSVTVVIPNYNYGRYLPFAVHSALDQSGVDVDVIIVDDKSTDGSVAVARELAAEDPRVTLIEHTENMRHIGTFNDGLSWARGDYVVLLSADDALTTNSLTRAAALMEAHANVGLVYGAVEWFNGDLPPLKSGCVWWQLWSGDEWTGQIVRRGRNVIASPEAIMRRTVFEKIGGYDPDFPHTSDLYMWLRSASYADVGFIGGPRQAYYRNHGENMHTTMFGSLLDDMTQARRVFVQIFAKDRVERPHAARSLARSRRSIAREALLRGALLESHGEAPSSLVEFQNFALQTAPGIDRSPVWKWAAAAAHDGRPMSWRSIVRVVEDLRWKIRSKRESVFGV